MYLDSKKRLIFIDCSNDNVVGIVENVLAKDCVYDSITKQLYIITEKKTASGKIVNLVVAINTDN